MNEYLEKYTVNVPDSIEDEVAAIICYAGAEGVEIEDSIPLTDEEEKQMYVDIPKLEESDGMATISFYLNPEDIEANEAILNEIKENLSYLPDLNIDEINLEKHKVYNNQWQDKWKEFFKPFKIDDISIYPTWEREDAKETENAIFIDPGLAFGTGKHETTKLCIQGLKRYIHDGASVLDMGTGSGILAIAAKLFGARDIVAVDIDKTIEGTFWDNLEVNSLGKNEIKLLLGDVLNDIELAKELKSGSYDVVVANILAEPIIALSPFMAGLLSENSIYIMSGILTEKSEKVIDAILKEGLEVLELNQEGDWCSIVAKRV